MVVTPVLSHLREISARFPRVAIVGVGDQGNEVVHRIFENGGSGAQCVAVNTNEDSLKRVYSHERILIEPQVTNESELGRCGEAGAKVFRACGESIGPLLVGCRLHSRRVGRNWNCRIGFSDCRGS